MDNNFLIRVHKEVVSIELYQPGPSISLLSLHLGSNCFVEELYGPVPSTSLTGKVIRNSNLIRSGRSAPMTLGFCYHSLRDVIEVKLQKMCNTKSPII